MVKGLGNVQTASTRSLEQISATQAAPTVHQTPGDSWSEIVSRVSRMTMGSGQIPPTPNAQMQQLSGLLRLQVDVSRYQLRVELVSKVSESAVASIRKLQQNG